MKKVFLITGAVLLGLIMSLAIAWWWLTSTRSGAEFALNQAGGALPSLSWSSLDGGLRGGLVISDLTLDEAGTGVSVDRLELAARLSLLPSPRVEVKWLRALGVTVDLPQGEPPDPDAPPFRMPDIASPVPVTVRELRVEELTLQPAGADAIRVDRIALAGRYHERLTLDALSVALPGVDASAAGHWGLSAPFSGDLELDVGYAVDAETRQQVEGRLSGRLDALTLDLDARGPARASGQVRVRELLEAMTLSIELEGEFSGWPGLDLAARDIELRASGPLDDWQASVATSLEGMDLPPNRLESELSGSTREIRVEPLRIDVFDGRLEARGRVALDPEPAATVALTINDIDVSPLYPDWPEQARLAGGMSLEATADLIALDDLDLSAPPTSLSLTGSGRFEPARDHLALDLNWNDLNWPPIADDSAPLFSSQSGRVELRGAISDWELEIEALLQTLNQPVARIQASARGDQVGARIDTLEVAAEPIGRLSASGPIRWSPEPGGQLSLALAAFDPGVFVPELPGRIDARMSLDMDSPTRFDVKVTDLGGTLRAQPLSGNGELSMHEQRPRAGQLELALGDNQLQVDSDDGERWQWRLAADALDQAWPQLSGRAELNGHFDPFSGNLSARGQISDSSWGDIQLASAELDAELGWHDPSAKVTLLMRDLDLNPWERVEQLEVRIDGNCDAHRVGINLTAGRGSLDLAGRGELPECLDDTTWRGALERLYIGETVAGNWSLDEPLPIEQSNGRLRAGAGCLVETQTRTGRICLRSLSLGEDSRVEAGIDQVPLDLLLLPLDPVFSVTTPLSGDVEADWSRTGGLGSVTGFLALGSGELKSLGGEQKLLEIDSVRLDLAPEDERFVLDLKAMLEGDSQISGRATLADLNRPADAAVEGRAQLDLPDIGVFNRLVPELDRLAGRLQGELQMAGLLRAPEIQGNARLGDGVIVHAPLGLNVTDIELTLDGDQTQATLSGRMLSGEGHLSLNGELAQRPDGWDYDLLIEGQQFSFADVDWLSLSASPRIQLNGGGERLELDGDIHVDRLRAGLPPGSEARVTASPDVRVRGETEDEDEAGGPAMSGRLGLHLGDDARLSAVGMQTELAGDIELLWEPDAPLPSGRGVIRLPEGSYRAYGQNLEINDGEIVFTGNPLDNPVLDIRAVRDIFGDPKVDEAGVQIRGNARNPDISLFTEPPTSAEKALAYVITGADFDHAGGQGAVNVGFYLLPRLFVSYGIGLFEAGNILSGRYELSERWGVRVVSGERDTGVDISFAIDR